MSKLKEFNNIYRNARIKAAEFNDKLKSREGASESLGISKDSLTNYELGLCKQVPVDMVVKMADEYNSPELLNEYCCKECPIGKLTMNPIDKSNINNIYKLSINIFNLLDKGSELGNLLLDIVDDGIIDESEKNDLELILSSLKQLSGLTNDLMVAVEKIKQY